jgi:hypothetical protein
MRYSSNAIESLDVKRKEILVKRDILNILKMQEISNFNGSNFHVTPRGVEQVRRPNCA